jgi:tetratricopeptide (TPR) repeat protein
MLEFSHQIAADAGLKNLSAHSLMSLGALARDQGAYSQARVYLEESLTLYRALEYSWGMVNALRLLGYVTYQLRGSEAAQPYYNESLELCQALKNPLIEALVWNSLGQMAHAERKFAEARELYCRAMGLLQERGDDKSLALVFENLGKLELDEAQYSSAQAYLEISLEAAVKAQDAGVALRVLVTMARLAVASGLQELRQFQIVELLERVSRHPACPESLRQEALDLLGAVAPSALVSAGSERSWKLVELKPLGYAVLNGESEPS